MKAKIFLPIFYLLSTYSILSAQNKDTLWLENFERDWYENWYVDIGTWEVGTPTSGPLEAFGGNNCAATVLNGNYPNSIETRLIRYTSFVVPSASENPAIRFWHWYSIYDTGDWGEVQIKTENGDWESVSCKYFYSGGNWTRAFIDLSAFADSTIQLAFYFKTNAGGSSSGWYIDDVMLVTGPRTFNNPENFELGIEDWTVERGAWEIGIPITGPGTAFEGKNCAATILDGNYYPNIESRLVSPPFVVPAKHEKPALRFWHWYSIYNSADLAEVQVKTENRNWEPVSMRYYFSGGNIWTRTYIDLSDFSDSTIQLAFYFKSDNGGGSSGWFIDDVTVVTGPSIFNNSEDFESGLGDWSVERGTWEIGMPVTGPSEAHGGQNCAGTKLGGNYDKNIDSRLISPPFIIPSATTNPAIRFWHWFKTYYTADWGEVQITTDNGTTWETISFQRIATSSQSWSPYYIPLSSYADTKVRLAFYFHSDNGGDDPGWFIDDLSVVDDSDLSVYAGTDVNLESCGSASMIGTVIGGTEPYTIEWFPKIGLDDPSSLTPVASPSDTTTYTLQVTDANGCFRTDRIVINAHCEADNTETDILSYSFGIPPQSGSASINPGNHTIALQVQYGTDLTELAASFTLSKGASATVNEVAQQSGYTINDFTNPVTYTITAEDGLAVQDWVVTASIAEVEIPDILSFSFGTPPQMSAAVINPVEHTVDVKVEHGTDVTELVASFAISAGATCTVEGLPQESGVTANNFTGPLTYSLTAMDGETVQDWVVTVDVASLVDTDILSFGFGQPPQTGDAVINPVSHTVDIIVEHGTDRADLLASYTLSDGATEKVGEVDQVSGSTSNDFSTPVTYSITASDGETKQDWIVTVDEDIPIGFEENHIAGMKIYPNPMTDQTTIQVNNPAGSLLNINVYGSLGNKIFEKEIVSSETISLKKDKLQEGVWMVVLRGENVLVSKMVLVQ